jgi:hypothetical protein
MSRLGYFGDETVAKKLLDELKERGLARNDEPDMSMTLLDKILCRLRAGS